jgi:hypothetical protein
MRFIRVEDKDRLAREFHKLVNSSNMSNNETDEATRIAFLRQLEHFDPYRLGTLALNNDSSYNKWKTKDQQH